MKKIISAFVAIALATSMLALTCSAEEISKNILIIGDSISTGYGLEGYPSTTVKNYGNILAIDKNLTVTNLAVDGASSADLATSLAGASDTLKNFDTIIVSIGGNDILGLLITDMKTALSVPADATGAELQAAIATNENAKTLIAALIKKPEVAMKYITAATTYGANLTSIITTIRTANPTAELYFQTIYNPFDGVTGFEDLSTIAETLLTPINTAITSNATTGNYTVIDVYTAFKGNALALTNITAMDIHPNAKGHEIIAKVISGLFVVESDVVVETSTETSTDTSPATGSTANLAVTISIIALTLGVAAKGIKRK